MIRLPCKSALHGLTLAAALHGGMAAAQEAAADRPEAGQLEEIVVTAQKRAQTLADVPIAVAVFGESFITRNRSANVSDLVAFTPGVSGTAVAATTPRITVRGVSTEDFGVGSDPALGIYVDDVYLGRGVSSIIDLFDIARVEVVRGPQGTLFGRNTTAGAISISTNKPSPAQFAANGELTVGDYGLVFARAAVNLPIGGDWALRIAGVSRQRDGYVRNTLGGRIGAFESRAGRATLGYDGAGLKAYLSGEYRRTRAQPGPYVSPVLVGTDPYGPVSSDLIDGTADAARDNIDTYRATLRIEADLGETTRLTSTTAYNGFRNHYLEDTDASPETYLHFGTDGYQDSYSQELRLNGRTGRLTWFVGASAARDDIGSNQFALYAEEAYCGVLFGSDCTAALGAPGADRVRESSLGKSSNTSYAAYGEATYALTPRLNLTTGLRWSRDLKRFEVRFPLADNLLGPVILVPPSLTQLATYGTVAADGTLRQRYATSSWQPRFVVDYKLAKGFSTYLSASRGYKAGGFNQLSPGPAFRPETIWNYEFGFKGETPDRRLRFDLAAFHFKYDDLQVLVDFGPSVITRNAATASGEGIEASLTALPVRGLTLSGGFSWQDVKYGRFIANGGQDYSGNRLPRAPRFSAFGIVDGELPLTASLKALGRIEFSYRSSQYFNPSNRPFQLQGGYSLTNLSAGLGIGDHLQVKGWVQNLFDARYLVDANITVPGFLEYTQRGDPRTWGLQLTAQF